MNKERVYYVYLHRRLSDNKVFYVGKGKDNRANVISGRNERWVRTYKKHGMIVEIVFDYLSEEEAYEVERDTVLEMKYFGYPLVNMTEGGDGIRGLTLSSRLKIAEARRDKTVYTFTDSSSVHCTGTRAEIAKFYKVTQHAVQSCIARKVKCNGIGMVQDGDSLPQAVSRLFPKLSGASSGCAIKDNIRLVDKNGNCLSGIRVEIAESMGWNLTSFGGFVNGCKQLKTFKGFALVGDNETDIEALHRAFTKLNHDNNVYTFLHLESMKRITCTRQDLRVRKGVNLKQLFNNRKIEKGYALVLNNESDVDVLERIIPNRSGNKDTKVYEFVNTLTNEIFIGDRVSFYKHTNSDSKKYKALFYSKAHKTVNGWQLK